MPDSKASTSLVPGASANDAGEYLVVARRYRPAAFEELIGQQHVARALTSAIETHRVGHAYLFTGARGVGKTSAARILAKALNCVNGPTAHPCNQCDVCVSVSRGEDVDVLEIDGASNRGIDEIRQLRQNAGVRPSRARFKIYIIDEVHMLTKEAFNALLKTLEEPPEHVKFIFATTEPNKIPITILSRCQRFDFAGIDAREIEARLRTIAAAEGADVDDEALLQIIARRAAGSMRDSQSLLEQLLSLGAKSITAADVHALLGTAPAARLSELVGHLSVGRTREALAGLDEAIHQGVEVSQLLDQLLGYYRDLMAAAVGCGPDQFLNIVRSDAENAAALSQQLGLETILASLQVLEQAAGRLRSTIHGRTVAEMAVVRIANLERLEDLPALIAAMKSGEPLATPSPTSSPAAAPVSTGHTASGTSNRGVSNGPASGSPHSSAGHSSAGNVAATPRSAPQASPTDPGALKKNGPIADDNAESVNRRFAESDSPAISDPAPNSPPTRTSLTSETALPISRQALQLLDGLVADNANLCDSVANAGPDRLVVSFRAKYTSCKDFCEKPEQKSRLERALAEVAGSPVKLEFCVLEDAPTGTGRAPATRGVSLRQQTADVLARPFVQRATELFQADQPRVELPENGLV